MKSITYRYLALLILAFCSFFAYAQQEKFSDVSEVLGHNVYVENNTAAGCVYLLVDGKVKAATKVKNTVVNLEKSSFTAESSFYTYKKAEYLILKNASSMYLFKTSDAPLFLSTFRSRDYWQGIYDSYCNKYTYLDIIKGATFRTSGMTIVYDDLTHIGWTGFEMAEKDVTFLMRSDNGHDFKVPYETFVQKKDVAFLDKDAIQTHIDKYNKRLAREKREREIADSIAREQKRVADSIANSKLRLAIAKSENTFGEGDEQITLQEGDTVAVFLYDKERELFKARYFYHNLLLNDSDIKFVDAKTVSTGSYSWQTTTKSEDAEFLKAKGQEGSEARFLAAFEYDSIRTETFMATARKFLKAIDDEKARRKKLQIFITGIGYSYEDNSYSSRFGMFFNVYNCFSKSIKYIELTMTNYNAVGDVQRDDIGRSTAKVTGIGPIEPGEGGRYDFDDVFWDDRDVIRKTKLTNVKILFTDGTSKSFSGAANIEKHFTDDAWDADDE